MNAGRDLATELARIVGEKFVSVGRVDLSIYNRDLQPRNTIRLQARDLADLPQAVVWPADEAEVSAIVRFAAGAQIPLIPMGAGSGGCGAVALGGIVVDLKRLNRILDLDEQGQTVTAEAGIVGEILERGLNRRGFTLGHFPSSISCSSYGGWLSTRAAGRPSARYGKIEDMVVSLRAVLPDGETFATPHTPLPGPGPDWNQAFVGAGGTLGLITSATCRIRPLPASRLFQGYRFDTVEDGFEAIRRIMQSGLRPAAIHLSDPVETFFGKTSEIIPTEEHAGSGFDVRSVTPRPDRGAWPRRVLPYLFRPGLLNPLLDRLARAKLVLTFEGDPEVTRLEKSQARGLCAATGGHDLGDAPALHWWNHRHQVSSAIQAMSDLGLLVDTIEAVTGWDNLANLYYAMRESIGRHALAMARFSPADEQGCSICFSIAATGRTPAEKLAVHDRAWDAALRTCVEKGGAISRYHGAGALEAGRVQDESGGAPGVEGRRRRGGHHEPGQVGAGRGRQAARPVSAVTAEVLAALAGVVGDANVITAAEALASAAAPLSATGDRGLLRAVARPRSEAEVVELIRLACDRGFALVTVEGALGAGRESVLLDLSHLKRIAINRTNLTVEVQAGGTLDALEEQLNRERLTLGPLPPAVMGWSVGEWLGRRGGFFPTARYGSFIDLVPAVSGVLAGGEVFAGSHAPVSPDLHHLLVGSRGLLAVITGATLSIRPVPAWSRLRAFVAPDFAAGLEAVRRVCASGHLPAQARLFDEPGTAGVSARARTEPGGALLLLAYEGEDSALSRVRAKQAFHLAAASCRELPAAEADQCLAAACGAPAPGLQVGTPWSRLREVLHALAAAGATGAALVFISPVGAVLGYPADTDEAAARFAAAAEAAGATLLGPRSGWPFGGPPAHRKLLREWKLRLDPGLVLNPALLPEAD